MRHKGIAEGEGASFTPYARAGSLSSPRPTVRGEPPEDFMGRPSQAILSAGSPRFLGFLKPMRV